MPDKVEITTAKGADKSKMYKLIVQDKKSLHVFYKAYFDYQKFDNYCNAGSLFLSRLKSNIATELLKSKTVIIDGLKVKDLTVLLGKKEKNK